MGSDLPQLSLCRLVLHREHFITTVVGLLGNQLMLITCRFLVPLYESLLLPNPVKLDDLLLPGDQVFAWQRQTTLFVLNVQNNTPPVKLFAP